MPYSPETTELRSSESNLRARVRLSSNFEPAIYPGNQLGFFSSTKPSCLGDLLSEALFSPQSIQLSNHVESTFYLLFFKYSV